MGSSGLEEAEGFRASEGPKTQTLNPINPKP